MYYDKKKNHFNNKNEQQNTMTMAKIDVDAMAEYSR